MEKSRQYIDQKNIIFVIEFKVGSENYFNQDKVQAIDYALDLKNFTQEVMTQI